jgi:probable rRNA maturation factor
MIDFNYETAFKLDNEKLYADWISNVVVSEKKQEGELNFIFCDDEYLLEINQKHLNHDYYTDVISFDYSVGNELHGDIFISIDRVQENATDFKVSFEEELKRVIIHGVLHFCGYKDKTETDEQEMRNKENEKIKMFHVEHS